MMLRGLGVPCEEKFFYLPARGSYMSECGTFWSSKPITKEQKAYEAVWQFCWRHKITFEQLRQQLDSGRRTGLPKWVRVWFLSQK